jgi:hypothetical protein
MRDVKASRFYSSNFVEGIRELLFLFCSQCKIPSPVITSACSMEECRTEDA